MVKAVPEGGNWKNIPDSIPSKRLEQIRLSFKRGEGSRSTYYGRLNREHPSYTINTYFNRPGNGCHIHYDQDRVLSQREAARLQSFPDDFEFLGTQGDICNQIGNAVPPLLAFQLAKSLGRPGVFVDLFAGAGGMGLGFKMAGWIPSVANDLEPRYLATYARNIHDQVIPGSITDPVVFESLVAAANRARIESLPFWVLGGPPCQGFSTAGNKRSMEDPRNHLLWDYVRFLKRVRPDGFIFENVTGFLNMQQGQVYAAALEAFSTVMPSIHGGVLSTEEYGIPQRRKRFIMVGQAHGKDSTWVTPPPISGLFKNNAGHSTVAMAVSVGEALSDLPVLMPGEDGSALPYRCEPCNPYQAFMRGALTPDEYLNGLVDLAKNRPMLFSAKPLLESY
jgi:DNA (cytosine-5)-methyltransferase 1